MKYKNSKQNYYCIWKLWAGFCSLLDSCKCKPKCDKLKCKCKKCH